MSGFPRMAAGLLVVAVAGVVAGCGSDARPRARKATAPTRAAAPNARPPCGATGVRAQAVRFRTRDGIVLSGAIGGSGPGGAVLLPEWPGDSCGWMPYAGSLASHGVRALLFDLRCFGRSG